MGWIRKVVYQIEKTKHFVLALIYHWCYVYFLLIDGFDIIQI